MSYQVLARKWRPAKFEHVVGQAHVLQALTNALEQQRLHHAYLFTGTRGVGKTTLARLFAKGLNCETGVTANPCGQCGSCQEIAEGRFIDLIEVDAASRTKVDDTREILENVQYRPTRGRYKVYLIDEVHMLSKSSFNALLKTLEEPPEHVKFLLATTDPQKLPITVLSRCLQFTLQSLTEEQISQQIATICQQEQTHYDDQALQLIAKAANGSMRDGLSLTDQALAHGAGQLTLEQVRLMLGVLDDKYVEAMLSHVVNGEIAQIQQLVEHVLSIGTSADQVLVNLLECLHEASLVQFVAEAIHLSSQPKTVQAIASQLSPEQIQLYYQILLEGRKELAYAPSPNSGLLMTLIRAAAFVPQKPVNVQVTERQSIDLAAAAVVSAQPQAASLEASPETATLTQAPKTEAPFAEQAQSQQALMPVEPQSQPEIDGQAVVEQPLLQQAESAQTTTVAATEPVQAQTSPQIAPEQQPAATEEDILDPLLMAAIANAEQLKQDTKGEDDAVKKPKQGAEQVQQSPVNKESSLPQQSPQQVPAAHQSAIAPVSTVVTGDSRDLGWYKRMGSLSIGGRVRQLAINSIADEQGDVLTLRLKNTQGHLNNKKSQQALQDALNQGMAKPISLEVIVEDVPERETPLEVRHRFKAELTEDAKQNLLQDPNVNWLMQRFNAQIDDDTVQFPQELIDNRI
ncbi:DNA polymerase III subunit gamma/tau [Paraferrimonas sp. SM1919]|uniref:DNA polymerase III subunit gamma/tau n=1 Tax=Paraferrimonas sp. SM1919 TaxID=2662263 RepID=UPI0013D076C7|nr:DNA polymerase III subunit gamma/tau [Paraferrimonas sp. SM1919]